MTATRPRCTLPQAPPGQPRLVLESAYLSYRRARRAIPALSQRYWQQPDLYPERNTP